MNSAPAWSTIATGLNPGRHGIFYFNESVPGTYQRRVINAARRTGSSLWRLASEAGKRVVVVNVPISYPAEPVNGYLVAGLDTPSKGLAGFTHPQDLVQRHADLFDGYTIEPGGPSLMRAGRVAEARTQLLEVVEGWTGVTERLMEEDWDLVFVVFTSSDTAQHFFWSPLGMATIDRVYEAQDEATARLVAKARATDPDTNVIVLADHGGTTNSRGPEFMPIWLEDEGLQARTQPSAKSRVMGGAFGVVNRTLSRGQKQALARRFPQLRQKAEAESRFAGLDWSRTRAYSDGVRDEVQVNLQGRDPQGAVASLEYQRFVAELKERIDAIRELDSERPAVASVRHREEIYDGAFVDRAPDLTIRWNLGDAFRGFATRTKAGEQRMREAAAKPPFQPGGHHPEGLFVAAGSNVRPGDIRGDLADVTPTILALLGVPVPAGLDGVPLDLLKGVTAEVGARAATTPAAADSSGYTAEEEAEIERRLEDLGYI